MPSDPHVSVVTPFYNSAAYLDECIESVLKQSFANFEYVLVNNHSTDDGAEIARRWAAKDRRIRVLEPPTFLDQVPNYNFALRQICADSAYTKMVQADDWIYPSCLREMVDLAERNPRVGVVSAYELKGTEIWGDGLEVSECVLSGREACRRHLLYDQFMFGSPTTVLYRSDLVRSRPNFYEEGRLHEDTEVVFELLTDHDFGFVHQVLTYTRVRENSILGAAKDLLTQKLDQLIVAKRFGPRFLDGDELEYAVGRAEDDYYRALGRRWLRDRLTREDPKFWDYQRRGLGTIGETLDSWKLARYVARVGLASLAQPLAAVRDARKKRLELMRPAR